MIPTVFVLIGVLSSQPETQPRTHAAQVRPKPDCAQEDLAVKDVIARHCPSGTPLAIDIAPLILIADELGMAIDTTIPRVKMVPLPRKTGQPRRCEFSSVLVLVRLEPGERKVRIGHKTEP